MLAELERVIMHSYPTQALVSPLETSARFEYDPKFEVLKALLHQLKLEDPSMQEGTRGSSDVSEEWVLFGKVRILLSYLGPFAAVNYQAPLDADARSREQTASVVALLKRHGVTVLDHDQLDEIVPWVRSPRGTSLWRCLFQPRD